MKIIIVGAGFTGVQLAKKLINGKNDVVLIDNNRDTVSKLSNQIDCDVIEANGNNMEVLEEHGIAKADALVCVTSNDELNMITCSLVDSLYPEVRKIARVRNYAYYTDAISSSQKHKNQTKNNRPLYGIDFMIHPDVEAAEAVVNSIERGSVTESMQFDDSPYELIKIKIELDSRFDGIAIKSIRNTTEKKFLVAYMIHVDKISLPNGDTILRAGDSIGILIERKSLPEFLELCGSKVKDIQNILLIGAGRIGTLVADRLIQKKSHLFDNLLGKVFRRRKIAQKFYIIENDKERAAEAEERFENAKVFHADATDESVIKEEGLNNFDLVICSTNNYEMNIVTAAYYESLGIENSIVLVFSDVFGNIARKIGIEVAIPIRDTVVDSIMSHLRGDNVNGVHSINGGELEITEITIPEESEIAGKKLMEISEPGKFLVLMGKKPSEEKFSILGGLSVLEAGDRIIIVTTKEENQHVVERFSN